MTNEEKAKIILEALDEYMMVNWDFEKYYVKGVKNGLKKIERREDREKAQNLNSADPGRYRIDPVS
ncbi:hypothetical protein [Alkalibacterium thalassium]|uniref:Uncharacterized protein n=1 Tax=Alkalibacterium thalassium TaxID=426701 RepID=A0A1G8VSI9_9LACT|nr:hypothetical protein [Alkalibacterium thalassium]SDJ68962.1 hypothetical protein SAMN04488098_100283 [Alkalibacterium thalassium]